MFEAWKQNFSYLLGKLDPTSVDPSPPYLGVPAGGDPDIGTLGLLDGDGEDVGMQDSALMPLYTHLSLVSLNEPFVPCSLALDVLVSPPETVLGHIRIPLAVASVFQG